MLEALSALLRFAIYATSLSGAGIVLASVSLRSGSHGRSRSLMRGCGAILALAALANGGLLLVRLGGLTDSASLAAIYATAVGTAILLQVAGGLLIAGAGRCGLQLLGAALVLLSFGVVGHAATLGVASAFSVTLHVSAAAWWLGGLWVLLSMRDDGAAELIRRFSRQALAVVGLLLACALLTAALLLDFQIDLARGYDRGLAIKAALTFGLLGLAAANRWVLTPKLAGSAKAGTWLRRSIAGELALIAAVLATTAWLTTSQSPHDRAHAAAPPPSSP
jgi:putative copper export protein